MNRRLPALLLIAVVLSSFPAHAKRRAVTPRAPLSPYLAEAIAAAEWITSLERPAPGGRGLAWLQSEGSPGMRVGVNSGAAGIGAYFLRLYRSTGDARWLDKAERGAQYVMSEFRAGRFNSHEWLDGGAGATHFLLELHAVKPNGEYLEAAHRYGTFVLNNAIADGDGVYWKHTPQSEKIYTGVAHGAAGTGIVLVRLYLASGDSRYLDAAERTYRWLLRYTLPVAGGAAPAITWKRLVTDEAGYHGWCGGSMGILALLDELHKATGKAEYLDAWRATIEGLYVLSTRTEPDQAFWTYTSIPYSPRTSRPIVYCHGTSSNATVLAEAAKRTGDTRYAEAAAAAGRWLDAMAITAPEAAGARWAHLAGSRYLESGLLTGTASVGHASLELYAATGEPAHLQRAIRAAQFLLATANHPREGQSRWLNRTENDGSDDPVEYRTGWYSGAAGIGIFLVELHDAMRGVPMDLRFTPMNP